MVIEVPSSGSFDAGGRDNGGSTFLGSFSRITLEQYYPKLLFSISLRSVRGNSFEAFSPN